MQAKRVSLIASVSFLGLVLAAQAVAQSNPSAVRVGADLTLEGGALMQVTTGEAGRGGDGGLEGFIVHTGAAPFGEASVGKAMVFVKAEDRAAALEKLSSYPGFDAQTCRLSRIIVKGAKGGAAGVLAGAVKAASHGHQGVMVGMGQKDAYVSDESQRAAGPTNAATRGAARAELGRAEPGAARAGAGGARAGGARAGAADTNTAEPARAAAPGTRPPARAMELPDGQIITIPSERFRGPDVLFKPSFIGLEQDGVHTATYATSTMTVASKDGATQTHRGPILVMGRSSKPSRISCE